MAENPIRMQCPVWERSTQPGKLFRGSIAIDSLTRLQVFDNDKWPLAAFPELIIPLAAADVTLQPVKSKNNTHKMGKITITASASTAFPSVINAGEVFTFILISFEDCETVIRILNSWKAKSK
jgi:hypothetical protein